MFRSTRGLFHLSPLCFHVALGASVDERTSHARLEIDAHGSAVPRALMRQEDQNILAEDSPHDTLWGRFFGTGSASIPDVLAVPAESVDATYATQSASEGNTTAVASESNLSTSNASLNKTAALNKTTADVTDGIKAASSKTFSTIAARIKHWSTQECQDTWEPEWSSEAPEENCALWAANSDWGALSVAASVRIACEDEWAQTHCTATCGCEVVKGIRLDQAILKMATGLGLSNKQVEEVTSTLQTLTPSAKEAVLHVLGAAALALNKTSAVKELAPATTTVPQGPSKAAGSSTGESLDVAGTTITTTAAAADILAMSDALGFDAKPAKQLNATLQLIPTEHYDDILEVLKAIDKFQPPTTTTTHASVEDIVETASEIGLKPEDVAKIDKTLSHVKPELVDEILATVNESKKMVQQIGAKRTGRAIVRHLQNLSWPSRDRLPQKDEPNDFVVLVASPDARKLYRQRQGHDARGFYVKVELPVERLIEFIRERAQVDVDPRNLSLAISRLEFAWPSSSCSNEESGFTDFKLLDFHAGQMVNEESDCGSLVASSIDRNGELRLPSKGSQALFFLAGMFGSKFDNSDGGAEVNLRISQLVFHEFRDNGDVIEYSICGRGSLVWKEQHFYLGCPKESPLEIVSSDGSLGAALKLCGGGVPSEDHAVQANCFEV